MSWIDSSCERFHDVFFFYKRSKLHFEFDYWFRIFPKGQILLCKAGHSKEIERLSPRFFLFSVSCACFNIAIFFLHIVKVYEYHLIQYFFLSFHFLSNVGISVISYTCFRYTLVLVSQFRWYPRTTRRRRRDRENKIK